LTVFIRNAANLTPLLLKGKKFRHGEKALLLRGYKNRKIYSDSAGKLCPLPKHIEKLLK
jgi:hypothetical protein